ncbi:MAG: hypothetical protein AB8B46_05850 [Candidatus Midichloriaceae bacterium]
MVQLFALCNGNSSSIIIFSMPASSQNCITSEIGIIVKSGFLLAVLELALINASLDENTHNVFFPS